VDPEEAACGVAVDDADGSILERAAEALLALAQLLLGLLLAGQVQFQALDEAEGAVRREHSVAARPDQPDRAVLVPNAVLGLVHPPLPHGGGHGLTARRA